MRLLVVGHPFLVAYNQKKYAVMKQLDPKLRLRLLVPSRGRERFDPTDCQVNPALSAEEVVPLKTWPARGHMTHLHNPARIAAILRDFQPDVIHIDPGEPQALLTVETIAMQRVYASDAVVTLFTVDNLLRRRRFPLNTLKSRLRAYSLRRVAAVLCCNQRAAELLKVEARFDGIVDVLPQYGLDVTEHQPGTEPGLRAELGLMERLVVGHVGRQVPEKGLRLLIEALSRLRSYPWKLLLVGGGPLENEMRRRSTAEFPGRIVFVPAVPYEKVTRYLRCVDIFVLVSYATSSWAEQFGLTLAQAMMLGIPSIGSSSGAIPEVLGPGGLIAEEGNIDELTHALKTLFDSAVRRERLGALGREFALKHYTMEGVGARYLAAFERARSRTATKKPTGETSGIEPMAERTV